MKLSIALVFILLSTTACSSARLDQPSPQPELASSSPENVPAEQATSRSQLVDPTLGAGRAAIKWVPRLTKVTVLYYLPNRVLDLFDIMRFDLGFGISYGAVVRLTKGFQFGYRGFSPSSVRMGLHGRWAPIFVERFPERGIGPFGFTTNRPRLLSVTTAEVGAGADVGPIGAYLGLSFDELADFVLGIFFIDFKGDDQVFK